MLEYMPHDFLFQQHFPPSLKFIFRQHMVQHLLFIFPHSLRKDLFVNGTFSIDPKMLPMRLYTLARFTLFYLSYFTISPLHTSMCLCDGQWIVSPKLGESEWLWLYALQYISHCSLIVVSLSEQGTHINKTSFSQHQLYPNSHTPLPSCISSSPH